ncbi:MAG: hypothetical protein IJX46_02075 [Clostridia bacterium]|nr:hypothetical protein [Clostridia bacterium]
MILKDKQTTVAYRCPHCGQGVLSAVSIFSFGGDMLKLKCPCGESELTVIKTGEGKLRLSVPCIACPKPHTFTVNSNMFFNKDLFVIPCPYTDINICFLGELDRVRAELDRTELELIDMMGEENLAKLAGSAREELLTDPQIFDIVMFVIRELDAENKIICHCEAGQGDYEVEVTDDGVVVSCKNCGASQLIPTDSLLSAHSFLYADRLILE